MEEVIDLLEEETPRLSRWKLIPGIVARSCNQSWGHTVVMSIETKPKCGHDILMSTLESRTGMFHNRSWAIKDMAGHTLGFLSQPKDGYYILEKGDKTGRLVEVLKIHYKYHDICKVLREKPARKAQVSILGRANFISRDTSGLDGKSKYLNTGGRGRIKSSKNMQLQNEDGKVVLQFVKWDNDQFHLDYKEPFDAFVAFGFAIAQLDLGMITLL